MIKTVKSKWTDTELATLFGVAITPAREQPCITDTGMDPREADMLCAASYLLATGAVTKPMTPAPSIALATEIQDRQDRYDQVCNELLHDLQRLVAHSYATGYADWSKGHLTREANAIDLCNEVETILHAFAKQLS